MTMTKHTPGPWRVAFNGSYGPFIDSCNVRDPEYGAASHDVGIERHSIASTHGNNARANARLIALAPEMVEMVRKLVQHTDFPYLEFCTIVRQAEALLARLDGAQ